MQKVIHCDNEPFRCKSDFSTCRLGDYGRGGKTLNDAVLCGTGNTYRKTCWVCDTTHEFVCKPDPKHLTKYQQNQIWKTYAFHNNRTP